MKRGCSLFVSLFLLTACAGGYYDVSLSTLLDEMGDRAALTRAPSIKYTVKQASSYDRRSVSPSEDGWFANADGFGNEGINVADGREEIVLCDLEGPGAITRIWLTTTTKEGTIRFYFDGEEEASLVIPAYDMKRFPYDIPGALSLTHTHYKSDIAEKGGNTFYLPIPYSKGLKMTLENPDGRTNIPRYYQINYRTYQAGTKVKTFCLKDLEEMAGKLDTIAEALSSHPEPSDGEVVEIAYPVGPSEGIELALPEGSKAVQYLDICLSAEDMTAYADMMDNTLLEMTFDGQLCASLPLSHFSGGGMGAPEVDGWWLSSSPEKGVECRFVLPYQNSGAIKLINNSQVGYDALIRANVCDYSWDDSSYHFHVSHASLPGVVLSENPERNDNTDLNCATLEGEGIMVGDLLSLYNYAPDWYGEGDEKIWVDDDAFPSHFGTGTEDYYNCSWAPVVPFLTPFGGAPRADEETSHGYNAFLRTRILDAIPFNSCLKFDFELLSWHPGTADYYPTVFYYGK